MVLVQTGVDRITGILQSDRPIALVPASNREDAREVAISARDGGFGVSVIEDRSRGLLVVVVGDVGRTAGLRRFIGRYHAEIATDRNVEIEKVYCSAGWLTGLAHSRGADVVRAPVGHSSDSDGQKLC